MMLSFGSRTIKSPAISLAKTMESIMHRSRFFFAGLFDLTERDRLSVFNIIHML